MKDREKNLLQDGLISAFQHIQAQHKLIITLMTDLYALRICLCPDAAKFSEKRSGLVRSMRPAVFATQTGFEKSIQILRDGVSGDFPPPSGGFVH